MWRGRLPGAARGVTPGGTGAPIEGAKVANNGDTANYCRPKNVVADEKVQTDGRAALGSHVYRRLAVSGPLDSDDMRLLSVMAGQSPLYDGSLQYAGYSRLSALDLGRADIVSGGRLPVVDICRNGASVFTADGEIPGYWMSLAICMESLTLPRSLTRINAHALSDISTITSVTVPILVPPTVDGGDKIWWQTVSTLYVPQESIEDYRADAFWGRFKEILPLDPAANGIARPTVDGASPAIYDLSGRHIPSAAERRVVVSGGRKVIR